MHYQPLNKQQRSTALRRLPVCPLFSSLSPNALTTLLDNTSLTALPAGETLFERGSHAEHIFLLENGQLKLSLFSGNGQEKIIEFVNPGESFAEVILFADRKDYPVTAIALANSHIWCIKSEPYAALLRQSTDACFAVMEDMSLRLRALVCEIDELTLRSATARLASHLLEQLEPNSQQMPIVNLNYNKVALASRLSIKPETLSRIFLKLSESKIISIDNRQITILDTKALKHFVTVQ